MKADKALYYVKQQGGGSHYIHQDSGAGEESNPSRVDLNRLVQFIQSGGRQEDGGSALYPEFDRIDGFIRSKTDIKRHRVKLLMFTVSANEGIKLTVEEREEIMGYLERAILEILLDKTLSIRYSSSQQLVLLIDGEERQEKEQRDLIIREFYRMYDRKEVNVHYDMSVLSAPDKNGLDK